jgi:hypothetical protein
MYKILTIISIMTICVALNTAAPANFTAHPNGGFVAQNDFWLLSINATRVRLNAELPWLNGGADRGGMGFEIGQWRERLRYGLATDAPSQCRWLDTTFPLTNWNLAYAIEPENFQKTFPPHRGE